MAADSLLRVALNEGGFHTRNVRRVAWTRLALCEHDECAVRDTVTHTSATSDSRAAARSQIALDVPRSMHFESCRAWDGDTLRKHLHRLSTVLNGTFAPDDDNVSRADGLYYYQGMHDIAAVLLIQVGPLQAAGTLNFLVAHHLKGFMQSGMGTAVTLLDLLMWMTQHVDSELHAAITQDDLPPHFALPWLLTWFSHDTTQLSLVARLFDMFLSAHPLFPVYVSLALLLEHRAEIVASAARSSDLGNRHTLLQSLPSRISRATIEGLIQRSISLYQRAPPELLFRSAPVVVVEPLLERHWPALKSYARVHGDPLRSPPGGPLAFLSAALRWPNGGVRSGDTNNSVGMPYHASRRSTEAQVRQKVLLLVAAAGGGAPSRGHATDLVSESSSSETQLVKVRKRGAAAFSLQTAVLSMASVVAVAAVALSFFLQSANQAPQSS